MRSGAIMLLVLLASGSAARAQLWASVNVSGNHYQESALWRDGRPPLWQWKTQGGQYQGDSFRFETNLVDDGSGGYIGTLYGKVQVGDGFGGVEIDGGYIINLWQGGEDWLISLTHRRDGATGTFRVGARYEWDDSAGQWVLADEDFHGNRTEWFVRTDAGQMQDMAWVEVAMPQPVTGSGGDAGGGVQGPGDDYTPGNPESDASDFGPGASDIESMGEDIIPPPDVEFGDDETSAPNWGVDVPIGTFASQIAGGDGQTSGISSGYDLRADFDMEFYEGELRDAVHAMANAMAALVSFIIVWRELRVR